MSIFTVFTVLTCLFTGCSSVPKEAKLPTGYQGLVSVSYSLGGGEYGGHYSISLEKNDGKDLLTVSEQESWNAKKETHRLLTSSSAISDLEELLETFHPEEWASYGPSEIEILDAPTGSVYVRYTDGRSYSLSSTQALPEYEQGVMGILRQFLESCQGKPGQTS